MTDSIHMQILRAPPRSASGIILENDAGVFELIANAVGFGPISLPPGFHATGDQPVDVLVAVSARRGRGARSVRPPEIFIGVRLEQPQYSSQLT